MGMISPPAVLHTERLMLRKPVMEDAEVIFKKYARDEETTRYLIWKPHQYFGETKQFIERCLTCWEDGSSFPWSITKRENNELTGMLEIHPNRHAVELGYVIAPEFRQQGYATEAVKSVIAWMLSQPGIYRVWATCDTENLPSAGVLEKAGMQREGILRRYIIHPNISDEPRDSYIYSAVN